jgi:hypothetical protein
MSIEYTLYNKPLSRTELLEQTDLIIKTYPSRDNNNTIDVIYDNDGGWVRIKSFEGDNIYELETGNKWDYIMDTIVGKFNITFYTDNVGIQEYFNFQMMGCDKFKSLNPNMVTDDNEFNWQLGVIQDMKYYGKYEVIDVVKGIVKIPNRILNN